MRIHIEIYNNSHENWFLFVLKHWWKILLKQIQYKILIFSKLNVISFTHEHISFFYGAFSFKERLKKTAKLCHVFLIWSDILPWKVSMMGESDMFNICSTVHSRQKKFKWQESHISCQKFDFPVLTIQHMKQNLD